MTEIICENVTITKDDDTIIQLIQYENTDEEQNDKYKVLTAIHQLGYATTSSPHPVVGYGDDPAVSWYDLLDIVSW